MNDYLVESTSEADDHARSIDAWWREHRPAAPDLFLLELTRALSLLAAGPSLGAKYDHILGIPGVRRLLMRSVRCHVYYTVNEAERLVIVRAIWHALRGHGPF